MRRMSLLAALLVALGPAVARGQEAPSPTEAVAPAADPADVESIDAIIEALYASISGPAGERDWDRLRSLFTPGALLAPAAPREDGTAPLRIVDVEGFIEQAGAYFRENPFYEVESGRELHRFGSVANAMSAYESRRDPGEEPFARGINTITLVRDGARWWVVSIAWDEHRPGNEIPADFGSRE